MTNAPVWKGPGAPPALAHTAPGINDLSIVVGDKEFSGWENIRVTRGVERTPGDFDITGAEIFPGDPTTIACKPGDPCQVKIAGDVVLTGYVDRYAPSISAESHSVRISGRGKCEDLVDCSANLPGAQISGSTAKSLVAKIAQPFGITVSGLDGPAIPQFNFMLGETPYEIIERISRFSQLMVYEDEGGNLVLAQVGAGGKMASGFVHGRNALFTPAGAPPPKTAGNVQHASVAFAMDQRFSTYIAARMTVDTLSQLATPQGWNSGAFIAGGVFNDAGVPRYRPHIVISEQTYMDVPLAVQRAKWECARRFGRSQQVRLTCDAWRDSTGRLWRPNAFAPVSLPELKLTPDNPWIIGEVSFLRGAGGTTAELVLMPPEAFNPEPGFLPMFDWQIGQELAAGARGSPRGGGAGP